MHTIFDASISGPTEKQAERQCPTHATATELNTICNVRTVALSGKSKRHLQMPTLCKGQSWRHAAHVRDDSQGPVVELRRQRGHGATPADPGDCERHRAAVLLAGPMQQSSRLDCN